MLELLTKWSGGKAKQQHRRKLQNHFKFLVQLLEGSYIALSRYSQPQLPPNLRLRHVKVGDNNVGINR